MLNLRKTESHLQLQLLFWFPHGSRRTGVFCCFVVHLINYCGWDLLLDPSVAEPLHRNCIRLFDALILTLILTYWLRCWTWEKQSLIFSCSCSSGFLMALDVLESSAALWSTSSITAVGIFSWTPVLQNHSTATALGCILSPAHLVQSHSLIDSYSYIEVHTSITGVTSHNKCVDLFPVIKHSILHGICACSLLCTELQKDKIWTKILLPL